MVETETGLKLKCLRLDNRGFKEFFSANRTRMEKTILEIMQQNFVAKRMNMTINEWARSMRLHVGLPTAFWANVVSIVADLIH